MFSLGAILAFGVFSFAPSAAHAESSSPSITNTARVEIITQRAHSVFVKDLSNPLPLPKCYNTPATVNGLTGEMELIGYSGVNCSGAHLCLAVVVIPPSGIDI